MTGTANTRAEDLCDCMVEYIKQARIERAPRTVPRHLIVPAASTEDAYAKWGSVAGGADGVCRPVFAELPGRTIRAD
jgi:protein-L-isoaspartate O-methyltransferase